MAFGGRRARRGEEPITATPCTSGFLVVPRADEPAPAPEKPELFSPSWKEQPLSDTPPLVAELLPPGAELVAALRGDDHELIEDDGELAPVFEVDEAPEQHVAAVEHEPAVVAEGDDSTELIDDEARVEVDDEPEPLVAHDDEHEPLVAEVDDEPDAVVAYDDEHEQVVAEVDEPEPLVAHDDEPEPLVDDEPEPLVALAPEAVVEPKPRRPRRRGSRGKGRSGPGAAPKPTSSKSAASSKGNASNGNGSNGNGSSRSASNGKGSNGNGSSRSASNAKGSNGNGSNGHDVDADRPVVEPAARVDDGAMQADVDDQPISAWANDAFRKVAIDQEQLHVAGRGRTEPNGRLRIPVPKKRPGALDALWPSVPDDVVDPDSDELSKLLFPDFDDDDELAQR